jgi:NADPH:quinone reductase-like Zn-dependent oxidoreductase
MITTEAWVLDRNSLGSNGSGELRRELFSFSEITSEEVLAEPIYGCWEANMTHAINRYPVDVCRLRCEERVVVGNAGVVRILETGAAVTSVKEGDLCVLVPVGRLDAHGYVVTVFAYDAPQTIGLLAKRIKLHERQVAPIPANTRHTLQQWAASSVRYATAWDNWKVAYGCWRSQVSKDDCPTPHVWGWGGGVALAELSLAQYFGCKVAMISANDERLKLIARMGITPIDRRQFMDLNFDAARCESDPTYRTLYLKSERAFLRVVREETDGSRVSIFIDNIGSPVLRATLKALARQGVITTAGWDQGATETISRINECISRHIHVYTHGARYAEGLAAMCFAEETGWAPPVDGEAYSWDDIPQLARDFSLGRINTYFPIYEINRP